MEFVVSAVVPPRYSQAGDPECTQAKTKASVKDSVITKKV